MIGLNLLPDVKKEFLKAQRTRNVVIGSSAIAILAVLGITAFLALFVYVGQNAALGLQNKGITEKHQDLSKKPEIEKYLTIQKQLDALKQLHDKDHKVIYSRLFGYLQILNPAAPYSVSLGTLKITQVDKTLSLQGSADNFKSLDVFKNTLEKAKLTYKLKDNTEVTALFSTVTIKSAALTDSSGKTIVNFEFILEYAVEAFRPDVTDTQLSVEKQTVSDAQNNAPTAIFNSDPKENQ